MRLSFIVAVTALCQVAYCQARLNSTALSAVFVQFPTCSANCAAKELVAKACPAESWQDCLCNNFTIQYQVSTCIRRECPFDDQLKASTINQNALCVGYPVPTQRPMFVRAAIIIAIITFPIIILRFISRIFIARRLWYDDWFILLAAIFMIPNTAIPLYAAYHGFGNHFWNIHTEEFPSLLLMFWVCSIFYAIIQNAAKFSILFLYIRIFNTPRFRLITQIFIGFQACHTAAFLIAILFQCVPVKSFWRKDLAGHCINQSGMQWAGAGLSIFEDFFIMLLPIWMLKDLQMSTKKKFQVALMFALGSFACVTTIIRFKTSVSYGRSLDETWDNISVVLWSVIETYTAVICSCLLTMRPLLVLCFPSLFSSGTTSSSGAHSSSAGPRSGNWASKAASKLHLKNSREMIDGDDIYLTNTTGSTMLSEIAVSVETHQRSETPRSDDVESLGERRGWEMARDRVEQRQYIPNFAVPNFNLGPSDMPPRVQSL